ncbi:biotin/lipoyl-binding protein [Candidatus Azambacteria bacterium]|nr:biotin/lipoyl-binding protein [Candidatus Azambacteria bacterium]
MKRYYAIFLLLLSAALIASILYFAVFYTEKETITLVRQDIREEVAGDGVVAAAGEVNIGFVSGGKIADVYVKEGDTVKKDDALVRLDVAEKEAERAQYEAKIEVEKLKLSQLLSGAGKKEIALAEAKIAATTTALEYARKELEDARLRVESELVRQYALAVDYGDTVLLNAENAANALSGIYDEQNKFKGIFVIADSQKRSEAEWQIMLERTALENIKLLSRAVKQERARDAINNTLSNFKTNLEVIRAALHKTSEVFNDATMIFGAPDISGYRTTVAVQRSVVNATQTAILTLEQNIAAHTISGAAAVHAAESKVAETESMLRTLEHELAVKKAFTVNAAVALEQAQIKEYEADLEAIQRQMADSVLRAPFDSVVRRVYARRGSVTFRDAPAAILVPLSGLQVDAVVPEDSGKKIAVGDAADIVWQGGTGAGSVVNVQDNDITVHFESEESAPVTGTRVMVRIYALLKKGVLLAPERFIAEENGMPYVYIQEDGRGRKTAVLAGMEWYGEREIAEGVSEGDVLIMP